MWKGGLHLGIIFHINFREISFLFLVSLLYLHLLFSSCIFIWVRKLDTDSLTETKNWSDRNEVIETSGRLHPLRPQNKPLYTPWTTDRLYTRQDRRIQTELAFTPATNDTKPNPFEIILLQTTRKENNWETEETLARAVVTLETERIKGSNPWCIWWWWWWWWWCFRKTYLMMVKHGRNI